MNIRNITFSCEVLNSSMPTFVSKSNVLGIEFSEISNNGISTKVSLPNTISIGELQSFMEYNPIRTSTIEFSDTDNMNSQTLGRRANAIGLMQVGWDASSIEDKYRSNRVSGIELSVNKSGKELSFSEPLSEVMSGSHYGNKVPDLVRLLPEITRNTQILRAMNMA